MFQQIEFGHCGNILTTIPSAAADEWHYQIINLEIFKKNGDIFKKMGIFGKEKKALNRRLTKARVQGERGAEHNQIIWGYFQKNGDIFKKWGYLAKKKSFE